MAGPRRFGLGVSAGGLPGDLHRSARANPDRSATRSILPSRPQEWSSDAFSKLRQQLASTSGRFTVDHLGVCPLIPRPMARRQRQSRSFHRTCQGPRQGQGSSRLIGDQADHLPREVTPGAKGPLGAPTYRGIEHVQEPNRHEAGHPGIFPDRPERNAAGPARSPNRAAEGRGTWRPGALQPKERGPASLLRADRHSCLPPLAGAGPVRWHRLGRLARSRAATRGLGIRSLAARAFGARRGSLRHAVRGNHTDGR